MRDECPYPYPTAATVCSTEGLLYYIWEREAIRLARENGHTGALTSDSILLKYKFTNIRRRDDRVSKWILHYITEPFNGQPDLWFLLLIARLINWPPTLDALLLAGVLPCSVTDFNTAKFVRVIEVLKHDNPKIYSGAYMVYPGKQGYANKSQFVANTLLRGAIFRADDITRAVQSNRIENFVAELSKCFGISTFIAGQVAADLTYSPGQLAEAEDLLTYAPLGPGSQRGLNYLLGRKPYAAWAQGAFNVQLSAIMREIINTLDITDLTLHDVQNCLCEYSKYAKAVLGEGTPKNTYKPEMEF